MSFNEATANAIANTLKIAPALASVNFDFTLLKVEAPKEFEGVGKALSQDRKAEAESGQPHVVARQLGALFRGLLPETPMLLKKYGLRASDIASENTQDSQSSWATGFFASCVGIDATTVWASATSGAIEVHLLACILARIWSPPEAVSIWDEIVSARKTQILQAFEQTKMVNQFDFEAAKQEVSRKSLETWDSSARAWLRTADHVHAKQQKQLMLILKNINQSINESQTTYSSVLEVWTTALRHYEALVSGVSQNASGELLVALASWHLYPDLSLVEPHPQNVDQKDALLHGCGIVTIGLEVNVSSNGLQWSLPLERLRHYGLPVTVARKLQDSSRLSLREMLMTFLGSFLRGWYDYGRDTDRAIRFLIYLKKAVQQCPTSVPDSALVRGYCDRGAWLGLIFQAAEIYQSMKRENPRQLQSLITLGRNHGASFLGKPERPFFDFFDYRSFLQYTNTEEDRIQYLRELAQELNFHPDACFIRYLHKSPDATAIHEYATALERPFDEFECIACGHARSTRHRRWINNPIPPPEGSGSSLRRNPFPEQGEASSTDSGITLSSAIENKYLFDPFDDTLLFTEASPRKVPAQIAGESHEAEAEKDFLSSKSDTSSPPHPIPLATSWELQQRQQQLHFLNEHAHRLEETFIEAHGNVFQEEEAQAIDPVKVRPRCSKISWPSYNLIGSQLYSIFCGDDVAALFIDPKSFTKPTKPLTVHTNGLRPDQARTSDFLAKGEDKVERNARSPIPAPPIESAKSHAELSPATPESIPFVDSEEDECFGAGQQSSFAFQEPLNSFAEFAFYDVHEQHTPYGEDADETFVVNYNADDIDQAPAQAGHPAFSQSEYSKFFSKQVDRRLHLRRAELFFDFVQSDRCNSQAIAEALFGSIKLSFGFSWHRKYASALRAVSAIHSLYNALEDVSVDVRFLETRLYDCRWAASFFASREAQVRRPAYDLLKPIETSDFEREQCWSCLCFLETGRLNIEPSRFTSVMAMSSGNSIFVADRLLHDPSEPSVGRGIQRIPGSINHPGVTFLVPPPDPIRKQNTAADFRQRVYAAFDGELKDAYKKTTMHLSFTTAEESLLNAFTGDRTTEAYLLQTCLAVHDGGSWVADLDVIKAFNGNLVHFVEPCAGDHAPKRKRPRVIVTALDTCAEVLDVKTQEDEFFIFRATDNWQARLAAMTVCDQLGLDVMIFPSKRFCLECAINEAILTPQKTVFLV